MKDWFQTEQSFERRVGPRAFVHFEDNFLALRLRAVWSGKADRHRHGFVSELTPLDRCQRFPMAAQREFVCRLAGDPKALRHSLGSETHGEVGIWIVVYEPGVGRNFMPAHRDHGHRFGSASHDDLRAPAHDALCRHGDRLQSRGTETIDGKRRNLDRQPCAQRCDASHVHALFGFGSRAAENYIFYLFGIDLRHTLERALDGDRCQFIGTGSAQRTFKSASYRSTDGRSNDHISHNGFQWLVQKPQSSTRYSTDGL